MFRAIVWVLAASLSAAGALAGDSRAVDLRGQWVFPPAKDFPSFTRLKIDGQPGRLHGTISSEWYGELPMLDLRAEGRRLLFKIDYLKYDLCSGEAFYRSYETVRAVYQEMGAALQATGRPVVFSLCEYGRFDVGAWGRKVGGNLWRTTGDISDDYATMAAIGFDKTAPAEHAGPGGWNDPDMLEVGNGGMSVDEYRAHMTLWALLAAPLLTGNDIRNMTPQTLAILANREVIGIDQDPLGRQAKRALQGPTMEVWVKPLADGSSAVGLFNRSSTPTPISLVWSELGLGTDPLLRDLWSGVDLGHRGSVFSAEIPAHGAILLKTGPHTTDGL